MSSGMRVGLTGQTLKNGAFNLATSRITADKINPQTAKLSRRELQILEMAENLARPGDPISPTVIAQGLGIGRNHVSLLISKLRAKGLWKYASPRKGRAPGTMVKPVAKVKAEANPVPVKPSSEPVDILDVIKTVCDQLRPLDEADRKKVLDCVAVVLLPKV